MSFSNFLFKVSEVFSSIIHEATDIVTQADLDNANAHAHSLAVGLGIGIVLFLIAGLVIGYFVSMKIMKRQLKKNPPISKDTIRMIYQQVGRKPSESQINEIYNRAVKQK
ncbi:YneF family protein [Ureaplasma urealyticum]|uniref:YneF family protein n=3 Tax=Ureaplasma urealyticum TaxID=2130 RepID=A0AAP9ACX8_UREUR|nr:conserved hypothetical protein [Ureaplasma urealyticum serovar 10 str. ATCC 33699]EDT49638.1 conserved hypothetical protein [Ureaplasma urealyticum serovar 13 str. ATCC 33698]EDU06091.1 conserved hypothetical protein [Ureaplasma urealyticum serovar 5 str. ATCC 27817]EDU56879.1 conserved hypothetical protein [Ureaplasma urealyticum serovar 7 str. ATCC 27819]EDU66838.1 conserved hypothetical protein [Ureaplasma urealyticum serovar 11 str. ATCC 33695]EDX53037.1 conserved hypothetical protein [